MKYNWLESSMATVGGTLDDHLQLLSGINGQMDDVKELMETILMADVSVHNAEKLSETFAIIENIYNSFMSMRKNYDLLCSERQIIVQEFEKHEFSLLHSKNDSTAAADICNSRTLMMATVQQTREHSVPIENLETGEETSPHTSNKELADRESEIYTLKLIIKSLEIKLKEYKKENKKMQVEGSLT